MKDADATAIYGSRGANGVILITTKKGKAGKTAIDANINSGYGKVARTIDLLNTQQYLQMRREAFANDGVPFPSVVTDPGNPDYDVNGTWDTTRYTNWQKELIGGTAHFTTANLSVSGGNTNTTFLIGGNYSRQTTVFPGNSDDRKGGAHFSVTNTSADQKFHITFSGQYNIDVNSEPGVDMTQYIILAPDAPALYDAHGNINFQGGTFNNPLTSTLQTFSATTSNLVSNLNFDYKIFSGLSFDGRLSYTRIQADQITLFPATSYYGPPNPNNRSNSTGSSYVGTWIAEPQLNYTKKLGQGRFDVLLGTTFQESKQSSQGFYAFGFSNDALISNTSAATKVGAIPGSYSDYRYNGLYGRMSYNWQDKYIFNVTARRDGSSRFGPSKQFGDFYSIAPAWIFTKEKWVEDHLPWLSFGKLRGSIGTTGNDQLADYQYLSSYSTSSNYQNTTGLTPSRIANPYFSWEITRKIEGGIDLSFLKDRIQLTVDYYRNRSNNQLARTPLPSQDGFSSIQSNLPALVQNTGFEFELNTINIDAGSFKWTTSFNLTIPRNKLISYPNLSSSSNAFDYEVGQPLSLLYGFKSTGVDPQTGLYVFAGAPDLKFIPAHTQEFYGGMNNGISYRQWRLDVFTQFVKQTGLNYLASFSGGAPGSFNNNEPIEVLNRWMAPGQSTNIQKYTTSNDSYGQYIQSNAIISDASFIRIKTISLSYRLPAKFLTHVFVKNARIYLQGQDLFTFTGYKGLDPETQSLSLPPLRMITAGIQIGL